VGISELVGIDDCIVTDAVILKDAIILGIHNQLHIVGYTKSSLANNWNRFSNELIKHRILKLDNQISKLWSLNDYNVIMIQYYGITGLHVYKLVNQFKEIKNITKVKTFIVIPVNYNRSNLRTSKILFPLIVSRSY